jgi:hypothetical protein
MGQAVTGVLSGFDRRVFRGTIRQPSYVEGMQGYLGLRSVLLKDFGRHAEAMTKQLKEAVTSVVSARGRRVKYLESSAIRKEDIARDIAQADGIAEGTIALLTCVERCPSFDIYRNRSTKKLELRAKTRKCLALYHYQIHQVFGFMHARIQSCFRSASRSASMDGSG